TFYGMSTFEGPLLSIKSVNALSHYTDWTTAHVHAGALGWVGFMVFGMVYWLLPRLFQAELWSKRLAELHFWIATVGILLYIVAIYAAGLTQGLMWRAFDETGRLAYPDFIETTVRLLPMYWVRVVGGVLYIAGMVLCGVNALMTWRRGPARYAEPVHEAPALRPLPAEAEPGGFKHAAWHRRWEGLPLTFSVWVAVAVVTASLFEIVPMFLIGSNVPTIQAVHPYTPLELAGRDVYVAEGCNNCHSQMIRPIRAETMRYGEYSKPGEFVYDHPFLWGSRRIGPDLARVGGKYPDLWHVRHMGDPRSTTPQSIMPAYPWLARTPIKWSAVERGVAAQATLGVPYTREEVTGAATLARAQGKRIAAAIAQQGGPAGLEETELVALVAYLQRLGTDIKKSSTTAAAAMGGEGTGR
ncbi:MAG TPA: cytochrome-c oxidase, cbb3-type subunit II, partial [Methylomirabilota bacterium]|nr:cytochrome-c oxidase, cbb3-type subunit II [Methylomirabilota bacterium]